MRSTGELSGAAFVFGRISQGESECVAIELAVTNGKVTTADLADERSLTLKVARNVLRQLTEGGLLEWEGRSGGDPRQYYRIANMD